MYIWATWWVYYKKQAATAYLWRKPAFTPGCFIESVLLIILDLAVLLFCLYLFVSCVQCCLRLLRSSWSLCLILRLYVLSCLLWSPLRFRIKTMFGTSLPPVVFMRAYVIIMLCLFEHSGVNHFVLLCVFTFLFPCCDIRCDIRIKTMFGVSLNPVVCIWVLMS